MLGIFLGSNFRAQTHPFPVSCLRSKIDRSHFYVSKLILWISFWKQYFLAGRAWIRSTGISSKGHGRRPGGVGISLEGGPGKEKRAVLSRRDRAGILEIDHAGAVSGPSGSRGDIPGCAFEADREKSPTAACSFPGIFCRSCAHAREKNGRLREPASGPRA